MPRVQVLAFLDQAVSASGWKPGDFLDHFRGQIDAVRNDVKAKIIAFAAAGLAIEFAAGNVRPVDFTAVPILKFVEAASPAPIAQGFPFFGRHLVQGFAFPERFIQWFFLHGRTCCCRERRSLPEVKRMRQWLKTGSIFVSILL